MRAAINDNMELVSVSGYRDLVEDRKLDFDGTSDNFITLERDNDFEQFSQEIRLEGNWDSGFGNINYVVGGYYWWSHFQQDWVTGGSFWSFVGLLSGYSLETNTWLNPAFAAAYPGKLPVQACIDQLAPLTPGPGVVDAFGNVRCDSGAAPLAGFGPNFVQRLFEKQTTESGAFFTHADWEFIPNWTLTAGIRYTTEKKDFTGAQAYLSPFARQRVKNFPSFARPSNKWNDVSPKAGLSWKATEDILVYTTYSEGWHSGGFFGVNQNVADFNRDQYDPEFAQSVEGGVKSRFFDDRVQANFAYFWNKFRNKQEQAVQFDATTNTVATVFSNVASAVYQGFEAEVQVAVTEEMSLFGTFGWLDAQYTDFETDINPNPDPPGFVCPGVVPPGTFQCIVDATFLRPRNAPKYSAGVGGAYTMPVGPGDLTLSTKYAYSSEIEGSLLNLTANRLSSRSDVQASLAYGVEFDGGYKAEVAVFGRNLTNERFEFPAVIAPLFASSTVGLGRTWGIQLTGEF
jgi:iron complex outermembrane receptor protein